MVNMEKNVDEKIALKTAKLLLSVSAVSFRFDPPFTYTSGLRSPIYLDNRLILSYPDVRSAIIKLYIGLIRKYIGEENVQCISGTATAAIPQAALIAHELHIPLVYCRSSAKQHGKEKQIEGFIKPESKVLIVEDHISTGGSAITNIDAVRAEGGIVDYCIASTTYETKKAEEQFREKGVALTALSTGAIIVQAAEKQGVLTSEEAEIVREWLIDPQKWQKDH